MGLVSTDSLPEALLSVAEKTLTPQPLFMGLSGPQLSRIAREVYVHLKNNGKEALAQQAKVLMDPDAIAKALHQLQQQQQQQQPQQQQQQQQPQQQPQQQQQPHHAAPCTVASPCNVTSCPCCMHRASLLGPQGGALQPQIVPVLVPPQQPQWQLPLPLQPPQQQPCMHPQPQQQPQLPHACEGHAQQQQQQQPEPQQPQQEKQQPEPQQQQQQEVQQTSRKACVARLLFAIVAAKLAREGMQQLQQMYKNSSSSSRKQVVSCDPDNSGMGSVSVEGLAAALTPERGFFLGLQQDLLLSLQRVVAAAVDGINAAMGAAGYAAQGPQGASARPGGAPRDQLGLIPAELPPLYCSKAEQGRTELSIHEKKAGELINKLLRLRGAKALDSTSPTTPEHMQQQQQQVQQVQQLLQQQMHGQRGMEQNKTRGGESQRLQQQQQHKHKQGKQQQQQQQQQRRASVAEQQDSDEKALDEEFKGVDGGHMYASPQGFLRAAEQHKDASPLSVEQQLRFYGLYKRATAGICPPKQPSRFNIREYKKWEAWKACNGLSALEAKREYVKKAREVKKQYARL
ncbi:uncharacterized protein EMH_0085460 [Eimeria mitis]|uniref:ACB domain-containing protein n=1 Tax=Eimeria mitis TaxID=44415 RepID=U6KHJ5_9EIME|nr:uncharacterized protein EMH_0085460 [Eimeria mitis]CDJ35747.1 hypothetical protein, conserved [Eimeria mitis]